MTQKRISNFFSKAPTAKRIREGGATSLDFTSDSSLCAAPPAESRRDEQRQLTQVSEPTTATLTMSHPHPSSPHADSQKADAGAQSFRPPLDYNFPVKKKSGESFARSCRASWFREWKWLEYISDSDGIVCGVCRSAVKSKLLCPTTDSLFLKDKGFSNWKKATEKIRDHEKSKTHLDATQRLAGLKNTPINALLSDAKAKEQRTARKILELIFSCVRFLGRQGLPLRGDANRDGVLWQLMQERVRDDPDLDKWLKRRDNWMSNNIQNEILELFAHDILRTIGATASKTDFFGLTADGTTDISGKEQFSISLQFSNDHLEVQNFFLGFYNAPDTTAEILFLCIKDVLVRLHLPLERLKGYCFDGASNMSGRFNGVQAKLKEVCPDSVFVHCANHSLDLVLQEVAREVRLVADTLNFVREVTVIINDSAKRKALYQSLFGAGDVVNLLGLCPTRWCVRVVSLSRLLACYGEMIQTFRSLESDKAVKGDTRAKIAGLLTKATTMRTVFGLFACVTLFTPCEAVARSLQGTKVTALGSMEAGKLLCKQLGTLRQDETITDLVAKTKQYAERYGLKPPHPVRSSKTPARFRYTQEEEANDQECSEVEGKCL